MTTSDDRIEYIVDGAEREPLGRSLRMLASHREVVRAFAARSFGIRYKQTVLGVLWAVIQPLATLAVFVVFFGRVAKISGGGVPYPAFALSALAPWQFVSSGISFGGQAIMNEGGLLRKVYFPREAPVIGAILANFIDLGIMIVLLLALTPLIGGHLGLSLVTLPLLVIVLVMPVLAVALATGALAVFYRDVKYILPFALQFWMFASPVVYPLSKVAPNWRPVFAAVNPLVGPLDAFRHVFALGTYPDWDLMGISAASGFVLLILSYLLFKRLEPEMADVV